MQTLLHEDLTTRHSLAAPATARELVLIEDADEWRTAQVDDYILGGGSNIIFRDYVKTRLLCPQYGGKKIINEDADAIFLQVQAGERWHDIVAYCASEGWYGAENLALIPGSAGAAPVQNIGAYGVELQTLLHSVRVYDRISRQFLDLAATDCGFAYRYSHFKDKWRQYIITALTLRLNKHGSVNASYPGLREQQEQLEQPQDIFVAVCHLRRSRLPDPAILPNAGSFFHNPIISTSQFAALQAQYPQIPHYLAAEGIKIPAAWCIEQCGFKGINDGKVGIYAHHALVLINHGGSGKEILAFAARIQAEVFARFRIKLAIEPTVMGEDDAST
ncbi:MAG: UDP-N-acetylmuramate dehydrogenase [Cardiobacteriaceae bacterium]|nr:UDP-N-acetylmuramate dehydrogenase [Cardiobacteriaceae bacterium]